MPVSDQGVTTDSGITFTWDELNNDFTSDKARAAILSHSGVAKDQIQPLLNNLRSYEQTKYKAYEKSKGGAVGPGEAFGKLTKDVAGPFGLFKLAKDIVQPGQAEASIKKGRKGPSKEDYAKIYQKSPLSGMVKGLSEQEKIAQATGQGGAGTVFPAISAQALQEYTKNYILPAQAQLNNMIQGDMSQWQSAINSIAHSTGQAGSPVTQAWQDYAKVQSPIYQALGAATARQGLTAPWTTLMNQAIGENAKVGERAMALGSTYQTLQQMGLLDPNAAQAISGGGLSALSGILGGTGGAGLSPLTSITQAATSAPRPTGAG